jgi:hypothetical protein
LPLAEEQHQNYNKLLITSSTGLSSGTHIPNLGYDLKPSGPEDSKPVLAKGLAG